MFSNSFFFRKSFLLWDKVYKCWIDGKTTDDIKAHVHYMIDIWHYKHTIRIYNTYCSSTATIVAWKRLNISLLPLVYVCGNLIMNLGAKKTCINKQKLPSDFFSICDKATLKSIVVTQSASVHCSATANDIPVMGSFLTAIKLRTLLSTPF
jgi:hypothetical protein